jgi:hypothetical protein
MRRPFGPVIAERRLVSRRSARARARVTLGQPRHNGSEWECPFRIRAPGVSLLEYGYGDDSLQALTTALDGIRALLDENLPSFVWEFEGSHFDHSGIQRQIPLLGGPITRRLERLVDRELGRYVRQLERRHSRRRGARKSTRAR